MAGALTRRRLGIYVSRLESIGTLRLLGTVTNPVNLVKRDRVRRALTIYQN